MIDLFNMYFADVAVYYVIMSMIPTRFEAFDGKLLTLERSPDKAGQRSILYYKSGETLPRV